MAAEFRKHIQFTKLEETASGERQVVGVATLEQPDLDREICDYADAKPVYTDWSNAARERTTKAGQEPSLGNVRLQHGLDIGGKVTKIDFDDAGKRILLTSTPLNDEIYDQLKRGFYTGYSQGGTYAYRKCNECGGAMPMQQGANFCRKCDKEVDVRYGLESLSEVSYVDSPCTGEGFDSVKDDGSKATITFRRAKMPDSNVTLAPEQIDTLATAVAAKLAKAKDEAKTKRVGGKDCPASCFAYVGDPEKTATWKLPIESPDNDADWEKRHIRNTLARFDQTKGIPEDKKEEVKAKILAAAKKHGIDAEEEQKKAAAIRAKLSEHVEKRATDKGIEKGMYTVGQFADIIQSLEYLYQSTVWEREMEGDDSDIPDDISEDMESLIETFLALVTEETNELTAAHKKGAGITQHEENTMSEELMKAAKKALARHFGKAAAHHDKMAKCHAAKADEHDELHKINKAHADLHKAVEIDPDGNDTHHADKAKLHEQEAKAHKALAESHRKAEKAHTDHAEHCRKMADEHDKEEAEKAAKEAGAAEGKDPVTKTAPAAAEQTAPAQSEFERKAIAKAEEDLLKDPDFMEDVKKRRRSIVLESLAKAQASVELENAPEPVAAKAAPVLIPRGTQNLEFAKEAPTAQSDCGV